MEPSLVRHSFHKFIPCEELRIYVVSTALHATLSPGVFIVNALEPGYSSAAVFFNTVVTLVQVNLFNFHSISLRSYRLCNNTTKKTSMVPELQSSLTIVNEVHLLLHKFMYQIILQL